MITGFHTILCSDDAEETRAFFRDVLGWPSIDAGGGWLIFKTKPSELGVHPTSEGQGERWATVPFHQSSMMCDDIEATIKELQAKGVTVKADVEDQGFGLVTSFEIPGAGWMMLYQPRHALAYDLTE
jgi:catechol 2,3-dioxygenase-like lactoylglutathione lyase family enzyme